MHSNTVILLCILSCIALTYAVEYEQNVVSRGKKKKDGYGTELFLYIADIVIKKVFILKLVYAFILWSVVYKAGYFLGWFVSFLKDKKGHHHEYVPHYEYGHHDSYGPYRKHSWGNRAF